VNVNASTSMIYEPVYEPEPEDENVREHDDVNDEPSPGTSSVAAAARGPLAPQASEGHRLRVHKN
jgi:hypothetical protein